MMAKTQKEMEGDVYYPSEQVVAQAYVQDWDAMAEKALRDPQAFWAAEAGLQDVLTLAQKARRPLSQIGVFGVAARTGTIALGSFSVDVLDQAGWSNPGNAIKKYTFVSTGRSRTGSLPSKMRFSSSKRSRMCTG